MEKPSSPRECVHCGVAFLATYDQIRKGRGKVCSAGCRARRANALQTNRVGRGLGRKGLSGEANPAWKGGVTADKRAYVDRFRAKYPEKAAAHDAVKNALRRGGLVRQPCEVCGIPNGAAHHDDYSKPLDVRWLCQQHHRARHEMMKHGEVSR